MAKTGDVFDGQFYADQSGPRKFIMQVRKITNEYKQSEVQRLQKEARQYAREMMARGLDTTETSSLGNDVERDDYALDNDGVDPDVDFDSTFDSKHDRTSIIETRNRKKKLDYPVTTCDKEVQVTNLPLTKPARRVDSVCCVDPKYLKTLSLIIAEGMRAAEALECGYIRDTGFMIK